ncbi:MAG TPA: hypothetical protein VFL93_17655 [Longimicrobiaceae bacterium]|nr:hypothetical protein [Longimicrobiaceae bacterium]
MSKTQTKRALREALAELPGVQAAFVQGSPTRIHLVCDPGSADPVEAAAREIMQQQGINPDAPIEMSYPASGGPQRRVRFVDVRVQHPRVGDVLAEVELEWQDEYFRGTAEGAAGLAVELRVCGQATLQALEAVLGGQATFSLVGIKAVRIFDHDLVATLVRCKERPDLSLVGSSLVVDSAPRAASLAVLNAMNRMLGNYLNTT